MVFECDAERDDENVDDAKPEDNTSSATTLWPLSGNDAELQLIMAWRQDSASSALQHLSSSSRSTVRTLMQCG